MISISWALMAISFSSLSNEDGAPCFSWESEDSVMTALAKG